MEHLDANQNQIKVDLGTEPTQQVNNSQLVGLEFRGHPRLFMGRHRRQDAEVEDAPELPVSPISEFNGPYLSRFRVLTHKSVVVDGQAGGVVVDISHRDQNHSFPCQGRIHWHQNQAGSHPGRKQTGMKEQPENALQLSTRSWSRLFL